MEKVTPFLWFDGQAEEAARFYASVFKRSQVGKPVSGPDGKVLVVPFEIEGQAFTALNGGPQFKFNESVSFAIECETQEEIDYYWEKLIAGGGKPVQCGWLKDRFGVSWQVVPAGIMQLYSDSRTAPRVMQAMLKMVKLDMQELKEAAK
jgi:predicted 3-demethylubiquinone-9 3-methyltransferase (glyoxalase superfamily)